MVLLCEPEKKPSQVGSFMKKVEWVKFWNEVLLMIRSRICIGWVCVRVCVFDYVDVVYFVSEGG